MIADIAKEKLEQLKNKLDSGAVLSFVKRVGYQKIAVKGEKDGSTPFPALTGMLRNHEINLEFNPYPDGGFLLSIELKAECPFKLVLSLENAETKSAKFKGSVPIPVQEIEINIKDFDDRYLIETLEEDLVRRFLSEEENRRLIYELENIDRLTFQYKYLKLVYYIDKLEDLDVDWVFQKIEILSKISENLRKAKA